MGTERSIVPMVASDAWASCDSASFFTPSLSQLIDATATVSDRVIYWRGPISERMLRVNDR